MEGGHWRWFYGQHNPPPPPGGMGGKHRGVCISPPFTQQQQKGKGVNLGGGRRAQLLVYYCSSEETRIGSEPCLGRIGIPLNEAGEATGTVECSKIYREVQCLIFEFFLLRKTEILGQRCYHYECSDKKL
jgi:hypothetical protein